MTGTETFDDHPSHAGSLQLHWRFEYVVDDPKGLRRTATSGEKAFIPLNRTGSTLADALTHGTAQFLPVRRQGAVYHHGTLDSCPVLRRLTLADNEEKDYISRHASLTIKANGVYPVTGTETFDDHPSHAGSLQLHWRFEYVVDDPKGLRRTATSGEKAFIPLNRTGSTLADALTHGTAQFLPVRRQGAVYHHGTLDSCPVLRRLTLADNEEKDYISRHASLTIKANGVYPVTGTETFDDHPSHAGSLQLHWRFEYVVDDPKGLRRTATSGEKAFIPLNRTGSTLADALTHGTAQFLPVRRQGAVYHHGTLDSCPVLRRLTLADNEEKDYISRHASLTIKANGVYSVTGTETFDDHPSHAGSLQLHWRFEYVVDDPKGLRRTATSGEKAFIPLNRTGSTLADALTHGTAQFLPVRRQGAVYHHGTLDSCPVLRRLTLADNEEKDYISRHASLTIKANGVYPVTGTETFDDHPSHAGSLQLHWRFEYVVDDPKGLRRTATSGEKAFIPLNRTGSTLADALTHGTAQFLPVRRQGAVYHHGTLDSCPVLRRLTLADNEEKDYISRHASLTIKANGVYPVTGTETFDDHPSHAGSLQLHWRFEYVVDDPKGLRRTATSGEKAFIPLNRTGSTLADALTHGTAQFLPVRRQGAVYHHGTLDSCPVLRRLTLADNEEKDYISRHASLTIKANGVYSVTGTETFDDHPSHAGSLQLHWRFEYVVDDPKGLRRTATSGEKAFIPLNRTGSTLADALTHGTAQFLPVRRQGAVYHHGTLDSCPVLRRLTLADNEEKDYISRHASLTIKANGVYPVTGTETFDDHPSHAGSLQLHWRFEYVVDDPKGLRRTATSGEKAFIPLNRTGSTLADALTHGTAQFLPVRRQGAVYHHGTLDSCPVLRRLTLADNEEKDYISRHASLTIKANGVYPVTGTETFDDHPSHAGSLQLHWRFEYVVDDPKGLRRTATSGEKAFIPLNRTGSTLADALTHGTAQFLPVRRQGAVYHHGTLDSCPVLRQLTLADNEEKDYISRHASLTIKANGVYPVTGTETFDDHPSHAGSLQLHWRFEYVVDDPKGLRRTATSGEKAFIPLNRTGSTLADALTHGTAQFLPVRRQGAVYHHGTLDSCPVLRRLTLADNEEKDYISRHASLTIKANGVYP